MAFLEGADPNFSEDKLKLEFDMFQNKFELEFKQEISQKDSSLSELPP